MSEENKAELGRTKTQRNATGRLTPYREGPRSVGDGHG